MWRLLVLILTVGYANGFVRITGGQTTTIDKYPYQVSVHRRGGHSCGGSLISGYYVLTAAHCVYGEVMRNIQVRVKSTYNDKGGTLIGISDLIWHDRYNRINLDYDVALIKLRNPVKDAKPVKLADASTIVPDGSNAVVTGWGQLVADGPMSSTLQVTTVPIVNWNECKKKNANTYEVTERMICAGNLNNNKNVCKGDSGGPLVLNGVQIGIVSWGGGCPHRGLYGVYTRVSAVNDWIKKTIYVRKSDRRICDK